MKYVDINGLGKFLQGIKEMFSSYMTVRDNEENEYVIASALNELDQRVGNTETLETEAKDNLVDAINEVSKKSLDILEENVVSDVIDGYGYEPLPDTKDVLLVKDEMHFYESAHEPIRLFKGDVITIPVGLNYLILYKKTDRTRNGEPLLEYVVRMEIIINNTYTIEEDMIVYPLVDEEANWEQIELKIERGLKNSINSKQEIIEDLSEIRNTSAKIGDLSALQTKEKGSVVSSINSVVGSIEENKKVVSSALNRDNARIEELGQKVGDLSNLITADKSMLVAAINELVSRVKKLEEGSGGVKAKYDDASKAINILSGATYDEANIEIILDGGSYDEETKTINL